MAPRALRWYLADGAVVHVADTRVTPRSRVLEIRFKHGAFVWQRPVSIEIERRGRVERRPIVDVQRGVQLALVTVVLLMAGLSQRRARRRS